MSRCGRCHGRGWVHPIRGIGQRDCPVCKGSGVKVQESSLGRNSASLPPLPVGATCRVCGDPAAHRHHIVPVQRINRFVPGEIVGAAKVDARNLIPVCPDCHHAIEMDRIHLEPHELPDDFWGFVRDFELECALPRYMQEAA